MHPLLTAAWRRRRKTCFRRLRISGSARDLQAVWDMTSAPRICTGGLLVDLIIRNALVYDGTGAAPQRADVGVDAGRIAAVGDLDSAAARETVDAAGLALAPGFIDMHSHSDWVLPQPHHGRVLAPLVEQGITTIVGGNCGSSPAPILPGNEARVRSVGRMLHDEALDYDWTDMASFLGLLEQRGIAVNLAQLAGHGTIRSGVKGAAPQTASPTEIATIADHVRAALDGGAIGLSTGLGYAPGVFSAIDELIGVTAPLRERAGVYTSHARSYVALSRPDDTAPSNIRALDETAAVYRAHEVKVQHSHLIFVGDATWPTADAALEHLERLTDSGIDIACDAFPYVGGNTTLVVFMPPWALNQLDRVGSDPVLRANARAALERQQATFGMCWADTQIMWVPDRSRARYEGMTVAEIAAERSGDPTETYLDLIAELGPRTRIINWNYSGRDDEESALRKVLKHPRTCFETDTILTGQGFDNPASYGTFPRILGRYVRELGLLTLEQAVHRMSGMSAERMNIADRGFVRAGLAADLVLFDPATIGDNTTRNAPDRSPTGIELVVLNGSIVVREGRFDTGSRAGRVLRLTRGRVTV
jgi:N-acyl-D-amino-acid deacylase